MSTDPKQFYLLNLGSYPNGTLKRSNMRFKHALSQQAKSLLIDIIVTEGKPMSSMSVT